MRLARLAALLVACSAADSTSSTATGLATPGVPTATTPTGPHVRCTAQSDNVLRFDCTAVLPSDGPASVFLEDADGRLRSLESAQDGTALEFAVWRIRPEQPYTVRVQPASGAELQAAILSEAVPFEHAVAPVVSGTASFSHLLVPHQCAGGPNLLLLDTEGWLVWYQEVADGLTGEGYVAVDGIDASADGVLAVVGRSAVREWAWTGERRMDLHWPEQLPSPVHHDVLRRNGHTYVLTAESHRGQDGNDYVMDGVLVYDDAQQLVASWNLADQFEPTGSQGGGGFWGAVYPDHWDWAHVNGIEVEPDGDWLISSRIHDAVIRVHGDWSAPDFGTVDWALASDLDSPFGNDFAFAGAISPPDFQDQHHPSRDSLGRMVLFDNRALFEDPSRATVWQIDPGSGTATLSHAWELGEHCAVQGSAYALGNEHVVATCAPSQTSWEFQPGSAEALWSMKVLCAEAATRPLVVRAMPLNF